jgi:hypothetical protein
VSWRSESPFTVGFRAYVGFGSIAPQTPICHAKVADEAGVVRDTLKSFAEIGGALVDAQDDGQPLGDVIASGSGWDGKTLVAMATGLTATMADDPLNHVLDGYHRFRRYAPRMLRLLDLRAAPLHCRFWKR